MNKRIIATITGLAVAAMIVVPSSASALTAEELQLQINQLLNQLNNLQQQLADMGGSGTTGGTVTGCSITSFTMNLKVGDSGQAVKCLQIVLNSAADTQLSAGAGSPGNETEYFGPKTKAAVIKFQEKYASEVLASFGLTAGTGYVGTTTRAKLNTLLGTVVPPVNPDDPYIPPVTGTGLRVALSSDNPVAGTLVDGQGLAILAKLVFTNGDSAEAKVTRINLKRIGVSADATLTNVYAFLGAKRLTDASSVSSGVINLNDSAGLFTVPAGGSVIISIKADIDGTAGETMGVSVNAATDVTTTATSVNGVFPVNGNLFTLATATLAGVDFASSSTPTTNTSLAPQDNYTVWQNTVTFTTRAVDFTRISFRKIGSVANTDLGNFKLYIAGIQVGSTVASLDANGYVTFDLSASPKRIEAGSHIIKLVADIIGGSNLNFYFSIRNSADANFTDTQYNVEVLPLSDGGTFTVSEVTAGTQTVSSGTLTVTKTADSPSGNKVNGAPNVTLAKYELKASGEAIKIDTLYVAAVCSRYVTPYAAADDVGYLRNGMLLANGVQIGSTKNLNCTTYSTAYQTFPLGSSLIVQPGSPVTLEVRADMYDNDGTDNMTADDTITARLVGSSSWENGLGQVSSTSIDVPAANKDGNQITVKEGALTLSKYTAYTDQTAVAPVNDYKLGHFTLSADTTEAVNISTITVTLNAVSGFTTDLYVKYGTQETSHVSTVSTAANAFSVNYSLAAGQTIDIEVYADVATGVDSGTGVANVGVTGTTADSATAVTGTALDGQTITYTTGSIVSAVGAGMPLDQLVVGSQTITAGKFKFTAANDDYTIREVQVFLAATDPITGAVPSSVVISAILKDGSTVLGTKAFADTTSAANDTAKFTGLSVSVPANTSKTLTVDLVLSQPSSTASTSQVNVLVNMSYFEYANSQGTIANEGTNRAGNKLYIFKSIPVVNKSAVTKQTLGTGTTVDLYKWTIGSEGKGTGSIAVKQMKFSLTWADTDQSLMELESMKLYKGSTDISSLVTIYDEDGRVLTSTTGATSASSTVIITFKTNSEDVIADGDTVTYTLKATSQGFVAKASTTADDQVSIYMLDDSTVNGAYKYLQLNSYIASLVDSDEANDEDANFIWSDNSAVSHSATDGDSSADWSNGYLVQNLPLSSEQWTGQ